MGNVLNKIRNLSDGSGFSLIETMIALCIFAIGFLAIASLQVSAGKNNRTGTEITQASTIAADQMERIMSLSFDNTDLDPDLNPHLDTQGKYGIQWTVTDTDLNADGTNDAKIVNMAVSWKPINAATDRTVNIDFIKPDI